MLKDDSAGRIAGRDTSEIAAAVRSLLADPPPRSVVAANAAAFSWEANAERLVEIWRAARAG